jgi:hypothetical protein
MKRIGAFAKIAKKAFEYNEQIGTAFNELFQEDLETNERYFALKKMVLAQAIRLSKSINELEQFIMSCQIELLEAPEVSPPKASPAITT